METFLIYYFVIVTAGDHLSVETYFIAVKVNTLTNL